MSSLWLNLWTPSRNTQAFIHRCRKRSGAERPRQTSCLQIRSSTEAALKRHWSCTQRSQGTTGVTAPPVFHENRWSKCKPPGNEGFKPAFEQASDIVRTVNSPTFNQWRGEEKNSHREQRSITFHFSLNRNNIGTILIQVQLRPCTYPLSEHVSITLRKISFNLVYENQNVF